MWQYIQESFRKSSVIAFARLQVLLGIIFTVLTATDLAPLIGNGKWLTLWLIGSGIITEITRKSGTTLIDGHLVPNGAIKTESPTDSLTK